MSFDRDTDPDKAVIAEKDNRTTIFPVACTWWGISDNLMSCHSSSTLQSQAILMDGCRFLTIIFWDTLLFVLHIGLNSFISVLVCIYVFSHKLSDAICSESECFRLSKFALRFTD